MSIIQGSAKQGATRGFYPYEIDGSLRFNDDDSEYLSRTPASAGNLQTWTWSCWVKRGNLGSDQILFQSFGPGGFGIEGYILINSSNQLDFSFDYNGGSRWRLTTTQLFRDTSAWYHIVVVADTPNDTDGDRLRLYVNGARVTSFGTANYPTVNANGTLNQAYSHAIGARTSSAQHFDGYLAEVNFIDGEELDPSSFGETKSGVWVPKEYAGTYDTNGFYLKFDGNSNDSSGEGNNWTASVTITDDDYMADSPTDNFATLNPLDKTAAVTLSNGNLQALLNGVNYFAKSTIAISSGKWYWEVTASATAEDMIGITKSDVATTGYFGSQATSYGYYKTNGNKYNSASGTAYGASYTGGDIIGVALDLDAGTLIYYKNGVSQGTAFTGLSGSFFAGVSTAGTGGTQVINFGQLGFTPIGDTPPTDYLALSTANLPEPEISPADDASPSDYFNTVLYTGNGDTQSITGVGFQPDWVWMKSRDEGTSSYTGHNVVQDSVRGVGTNTALVPNEDYSEAVTGYSNALTAFDSDGFSLGDRNQVNFEDDAFVAWNWKAGGTGVSNTAGSITSTVSANTTSGFSIVSYTGTGANATVGHGLDSAPEMVIVKVRSTSNNWPVYHVATGNGNYTLLNTEAASAADGGGFWNGTTPSDSVVSLGSAGAVNAVTATFIAYCFHSVEGFSKFGSYEGGSDAFVYTGFRPAMIICKNIDGTAKWGIKDNARSPYNPTRDSLYPDSSLAAYTGDLHDVDFLSNGFKLRNADAIWDGSATYIYMAFAENPFKYANAR
jgi:hypothetical protein